MKMYSIMFFVICANVAAFIISQSGMLTVGQELPYNPENIMATFTLDRMWISLGISGAVGGFMMLVTSTLVFSSVAFMVAWAVCNIFPVLEWIVGGVPLMMEALLPSELWYVSVSIRAFFAVIFFVFMIEVMTQRRLT